MKLYRGARQLQALVRLRTTSHSSGPSSPGPLRGTRRGSPRAAIVTPNGVMLRTHQSRRPQHTTGPSSWRAP